MNACIVAVGSEMLTPFRVDTNSLFITERLNAIGCDVRLKAVVGDDVGELARLLEEALAWAGLIVITGGLGSMPGALLGGVLIGVTEALGGLLFTPSAKSMFAFGLLVLVLLFRPQGILGKRQS